MSRFFINIIVFGLWLMLIVLMLLLISVKINSNMFKKYKLPSNTENILIGDSHLQLTLVDSLLPKTKNMGKSGEPIMMTYYKLEDFIFNNPNIKRVYLSVGYHNISSSHDRYLYGGNDFEIPARYFPILPINQKLKMFRENKNDFFRFLSKIVVVNTKAILLDRMPMLGSYKNDFQNTSIKQNAVNKRINNQFYDENGKLDGYSKLSVNFIEKINLLCQNANIELIIVKTPVHESYAKLVPQKFKLKYDSIIYSTNNKLIDLENDNLLDTDFIPDGDHVSAQGALKTTKKFKELIR